MTKKAMAISSIPTGVISGSVLGLFLGLFTGTLTATGGVIMVGAHFEIIQQTVFIVTHPQAQSESVPPA